MNKEYHNQYNLKRYHQKRQEYISLLGGKCNKCGCTENLHFDHINAKEKSFSIGDKITYPKEVILEELKKCQLLCKECHIQKTRECKDGYNIRIRGEQIAISKLNPDKVRQIRKELEFMSQNQIAKKYGVTRASIRFIRDGITWKHIT